MECPAQAILGVVEKVLVRMEQASHLGHSENGGELASGGVSFVLGLGLKI